MRIRQWQIIIILLQFIFVLNLVKYITDV